MKLQDRLPNSVSVRGKKIKLDLDFRNVLRMIDILARDDLIPEARVYRALRCVTRRPKFEQEMLRAVMAVLFPATKKSPDRAKIMDYEQDADLIRAAFRQAYGIDLWRDKLHWLEFQALLAGLPEGSRYSEVLGIRARPMPAPTKYNADERKWLAKAKADLALKLSEDERQAGFEKGARLLAESLITLANYGQKGGEDNGG